MAPDKANYQHRPGTLMNLNNLNKKMFIVIVPYKGVHKKSSGTRLNPMRDGGKEPSPLPPPVGLLYA